MNTPTKKITTPQAGVEVELKAWITGAEAEYIDEALFAGVEIKPDLVNRTAKMGNFDTKAIDEQTHREIEKFVISVGGKTEKVLQEVLSLPEADYAFVKAEIQSRRGKKKVKEDGQQAQ